MSSSERSRPRVRGFTLIELLVTISIIALLMGILIGALAMARNHSRRTVCASNLRQIHLATEVYLQNYKQTYYWRGAVVSLDGMDWFTWGGRETGNQNLGQGGLFNNVVPRPLNNVLDDDLDIFRCPFDAQGIYSFTGGASFFEYVGNTYTFNSTGHVNVPPTDPDMGLAGRRAGDIHEPSKTVEYLDTFYRYLPEHWHADNGNIGFADGHVKTAALPDPADEDFAWGP